MSERDLAVLIPEEHAKFLQEVILFCEKDTVISVTISTDDELQAAGAIGKELRFQEKAIEDRRVAAKAPILAEGKKIDARYNEVKAIVKNRVDTLAAGIRKYQKEQEQKRIEAQRKADEEARKERLRIEELARKQREKEDAALKAAEEKFAQAKAAENEQERLKLEAEARKLEQRAETAAEKAFIKENISEQVIAPVVAEVATVKGVSSRANWKARPISIEDLAKHCVETGQYELLDFNMVNLNKYAKMLKDTKKIPGVEFWNDESTTFRR